MLKRHLKMDDDGFHLAFRGKGGKSFNLDLNDRRLARIVNHCQDLPGQELFQYVDEEGKVVAVTPGGGPFFGENASVKVLAGDDEMTEQSNGD